MATLNCKPYGPPEVDGIWGIWGYYYNIPKTIFCLLKGDYWGMGRKGARSWLADVGVWSGQRFKAPCSRATPRSKV